MQLFPSNVPPQEHVKVAHVGHSLRIRFHIQESGEGYLPGNVKYLRLRRQQIGQWLLERRKPNLMIFQIAFLTSIGALAFQY